ncbi:hypothetical protein MRX96_024939 [Rhipicephalus microplus]
MLTMLGRTPYILTITACCFLQYLRGQHHERLPRNRSCCACWHCHSGAKSKRRNYVPGQDVLVLGEASIPNNVADLLRLGPKYCEHPDLDKTELLSLVKADTISKCFNGAGFVRNAEALENDEQSDTSLADDTLNTDDV